MNRLWRFLIEVHRWKGVSGSCGGEGGVGSRPQAEPGRDRLHLYNVYYSYLSPPVMYIKVMFQI